MNIQKLYEALDEDEMNSAVGIMCSELERQGYQVRIDGNAVSSESLFENEHEQLEGKTTPLRFSLYRGSELEQEFLVQFIEYHEFVVKKLSNGA